MSTMASQITSLTIAYTAFFSGADQRKHRSSASLAVVRGNHRWPVTSPQKWPVTPTMFLFDDVIILTAMGLPPGGNLGGRYLIILPYYQVSAIHHDDVIKWKHFSRYWPFVRGIHRWPVNSSRKDQWRGALIFSLICAWIDRWANNREAADLRRHHAHYDVTVVSVRPGNHRWY